MDFHCHLDLFPDFEAAVDAAELACVYTLTVTTTPKAWPRNHEVTRGTRFVRAALGLHPQVVSERAHEILEWEKYLPEARYIGEVGLNAGPRFYKSFDRQKEIFQFVLDRCARIGGKVLTIHSVRCASIVLDMIEAHLPRDRGHVVLHWFTGSRAEARRGVELGCYFSVNAEMAQSERGRQVIAELPPVRLLTETDGPFTKTRGQPSVPADVHLAVEAIASVRKVSPIEVANAVRSNLRTLVTAEEKTE